MTRLWVAQGDLKPDKQGVYRFVMRYNDRERAVMAGSVNHLLVLADTCPPDDRAYRLENLQYDGGFLPLTEGECAWLTMQAALLGRFEFDDDHTLDAYWAQDEVDWL